jgi:hypothetical protein
MKILKKGREQKSWTKEFDCTGRGSGGGGCGARLLVSKDDLYAVHLAYFDESERHVMFRCPACGVETEITHYDGPWDLPSRDAWLKRQGTVP